MVLTESQVREKLKTYAPLVQKYDSPISVATRLAQLIVESQIFTSELAKKSNNGFGIKASAPWDGDSVPHVSGEVGGARESSFRKYPSEEASIKDHAGFFTSTDFRATDAVYGRAIKADNYKDEAKNLGPKFVGDTSSYAGDPEYANKLINQVDKYNLTQFDNEKKGTDNMSTFTPTIIDRRQYAMGGQAWNRNKSAISVIAWHYTAVARRLNRKIWDHEQYWKNTHGWDRGGYHYYIDSDGVIYHNYNYERITWGVAHNNNHTVHISVEANSANDYSEAQKQAREWLTRKIMADLGIKSNKVLMHKEVYNNSNCCGYTTAQMNEFRNVLSKAQTTTPVLDDRFVELPTYRTPVNPFKELKVGDKITIREGFQAWHNPADDPKVQGDEAIKASRDFVGRTGTIKKVKAVNVGYSKRAYLIVDESNPKDPLNSWIHEHDVLEAREHWVEVEDDAPEQAIPETDDSNINDDLEPAPDNDFRENYIYWDGVKYKVGEEID